MIKRDKYLNKIIPFIDKQLIKVLIGVRRSGKTVLLGQIRDHILAGGVSAERILYLNFESFASRRYTSADELYDLVITKSRDCGGERIYLFLDEIQEVKNWQKVVDSLSVDIDCDIYLTGSNSNLLSGELATYISGRYVHFDIFPFSLAECIEAEKQRGNFVSLERSFDDYLRLGGLPQRFVFDDESAVHTYIDDVFNTIVVKDVIARNNIGDAALLTRLTSFLLDNIGNPFSANSIRNTLRSFGVKTSVTTILSYIAALQNAMIVLTAPRYDLKGKALLSTNEKYYATDLGLRNIVKSSELIDYNKLYENAVYLELLSRGYKVYVGKVDDLEIDFVCTKSGGEKLYVQVAYLLADASVVKREFRPLEKIDDNFPKFVISGDRHDFSSGGIVHKNILTFLTEVSA